jgi:uncharacterized RDD family membrane protein YckC
VKPAPAPPAAFELLVLDGRPTLWYAGDAGAGAIVAHAPDPSSIPREWSEPVELQPASPPAAGADRAVATALRRLRLLVLPGDRQLIEQPFAPDGAPLGPPTQVTVLQSLGQPDPRVQHFMQLVVLILLTFILFGTFRRRGPLQEAMRKADRSALAPLFPRFVAGLIDAVPLLIVPAYVAARAVAENDTAAHVEARFLDPQVQMWQAVTILAYLVHTTASELLAGRTLGKALLGLRVTSLDGSPPPTRAVLSRNLLRIIDVILPLLLLMVAFSPLRQRLGDVAAGTLVVSDRARRAAKSNSPAAAADADDS